MSKAVLLLAAIFFAGCSNESRDDAKRLGQDIKQDVKKEDEKMSREMKEAREKARIEAEKVKRDVHDATK
jgi:hypothetical protein